MARQVGVKRPLPDADPAAAAAAEHGPADVEPPTPSAREQRLWGKTVEDEDEDEEAGGIGFLMPAQFAREEGYQVLDVPGASAPLADDILGPGTMGV